MPSYREEINSFLCSVKQVSFSGGLELGNFIISVLTTFQIIEIFWYLKLHVQVLERRAITPPTAAWRYAPCSLAQLHCAYATSVSPSRR
jgi:hypothetical protein